MAAQERTAISLSSEVVEKVQAIGPSELKLRCIREAMKSLPNHVFVVAKENTVGGETGTDVMATERTFDKAFEVVVADAEAESYENYDTGDEDSDAEPEDQRASSLSTSEERKKLQSNRERLIRIARVSTRGTVTFNLVNDDDGYAEDSLMITIARSPVGARGNEISVS